MKAMNAIAYISFSAAPPPSLSMTGITRKNKLKFYQRVIQSANGVFYIRVSINSKFRQSVKLKFTNFQEVSLWNTAIS